MPQSFARALMHLVFSTKHREPFLKPEYQSPVHAYLAKVLDSMDCPSYRVGGVEDHVHLLFGLSRTRTMAAVAERVKTSSSKWIKEQFPELGSFHWQRGYGIFSVSQSDFESVATYVERQQERHAKSTFQDEYRRLLELHEVAYDERYIWD